MHEFIRWALAPWMSAWAASAERELESIPRPTDAPQAHSAGIDSDRVLIIGSGPAVGWGVLSHDLALPGALARSLSARTGRGVDVNVIASPRFTVSSVRHEFEGLKLWQYDAIVVALGANDALTLTSERLWKRELTAALRLIERDASRRSHVFVVGIHSVRPMPIYDTPLGAVADHHARSLNGVTARICEELPGTTFVEFTPTPRPSSFRHRTAADYRHWAELLANEMAAVLDTRSPRAFDDAGEPVSHHVEWLEPDRQRAVEGLVIIDSQPEERFDRIVALAQRSFGTRLAVFALTDGDRLWVKASVGPAPKVLPRSNSFCTLTIQGSGATIVPDALADARFRDNPFVLGEPHIRFYAGFPVESPSGERIGVLGLLDPDPRPAEEVDIVLLRELALMVQSELQRGPVVGARER